MEFAGMHGTGYANMALQHCDVMLAVGTRFDDRLTGGVETFAPDAEIVHVDIDPAEISKNVAADHALVGDAARVLAQLDAATPRAPDADDWRDQCRRWRDEYALTYDQPADGPLKPQIVVEALDDATGDDAILSTGVGQHQMWAVQFWTFREPRTWVSSHGLGTMGYGLPAAIGARYAASGASETHRGGGDSAERSSADHSSGRSPREEAATDDDQQVVCVEGDGSFLMTTQELAVAVRENLDVTVVVLNNEAIGMVRQWQDAFFDGRRTASEYPWMPAFEPLAEAFGAYGDTVEHPDEVADALADAVAHDGPAVVDCHVDPGENVYPMVPSGGDNGRFALSEDQL
jgi:acetolactate synthase-1/2/3 large subunit